MNQDLGLSPLSGFKHTAMIIIHYHSRLIHQGNPRAQLEGNGISSVFQTEKFSCTMLQKAFVCCQMGHLGIIPNARTMELVLQHLRKALREFIRTLWHWRIFNSRNRNFKGPREGSTVRSPMLARGDFRLLIKKSTIPKNIEIPQKIPRRQD